MDGGVWSWACIIACARIASSSSDFNLQRHSSNQMSRPCCVAVSDKKCTWTIQTTCTSSRIWRKWTTHKKIGKTFSTGTLLFATARVFRHPVSVSQQTTFGRCRTQSLPLAPSCADWQWSVCWWRPPATGAAVASLPWPCARYWDQTN